MNTLHSWSSFFREIYLTSFSAALKDNMNLQKSEALPLQTLLIPTYPAGFNVL